ncbi:hypothetical protein HID58_008946, partial [Brassica napus]
GVHVAIHVINSDAVKPTPVPHYQTQRIIKLITSDFFVFGPLNKRPGYKTTYDANPSCLLLRASVRCTRATTPDSERRLEALGRVYNTRTFVPVHRRMDRVGGEKLE